MTLIVGIKLPKGILIISDTRETDMRMNVTSDYKRKIVRIAPTCFLATAGSESTFYAARILRNCLYNSGTIESINKNVLVLFKKVNQIYKEINLQPVGPIMLAQYDENKEQYKLLSVDPESANEYETLVEAFDVISIGGNAVIRHTIETYIRDLMKSLGENIHLEGIYDFVTRNVHHFIKQLSNPTIGKHLLVAYLTSMNGNTVSANLFIKENDEKFNIDPQQDSEIITINS